jgi:hypothetical protein
MCTKKVMQCWVFTLTLSRCHYSSSNHHGAGQKQALACYLLHGVFLLDLLFNIEYGEESSEKMVGFQWTKILKLFLMLSELLSISLTFYVNTICNVILRQ